MTVSYINHEDSLDGPDYPVWSTIYAKAGSMISEASIARELCEQRDVERLEDSIKLMRDLVLAMGKGLRELQAKTAPAQNEPVAP
jgi:hypothetical protein